MTTPGSSPAHDMARQLLAQAISGATQPTDVGAAMQRVCTRVSENLRRTVGDDGYDALIARALRRTEAAHPAVTDIRRVDDGTIHLDGVLASIGIHGLVAVTAALEAVFEALIDILSGLVGADMVLSLLDYDGPPSQATRGRQTQ
jgi:hypothetical protein